MAKIDEIVNISIDLQTTAVSRAGFGTLLFLGDTEAFPLGERVRVYSSIDEVAADFSTSDPEFIAANTYFAQSPPPSQIKIGQIETADADITAALNAVEEFDSDWYGLAIESRAVADQEAAAAWVEARRKLFGLASNDAAIIDSTEGADDAATGSIFARLNLTNFRTFGLYHDFAGGDLFPDVAWIGEMFTRDPGEATWMFKSLGLISPVSLTSSQAKNALDKNGNTYEQIGGVPITRRGTVFGGSDETGEYIDVIRGTDWLQARMTERIFSRLVNLPKIPYTDAGVSIIVAEIRAQLQDAIAQGVLANDPAPTVSAPLVADVPFNDKALRQLPDIEFTGTLQGAVHAVTVQGVITL